MNNDEIRNRIQWLRAQIRKYSKLKQSAAIEAYQAEIAELNRTWRDQKSLEDYLR